MIGAVIQARMGSSRFPGKSMAMLGSKRLIDWVIDGVASSTVVDDVIVATTTLTDDDELYEHVRALGISCFRGHPEDVLDRYFMCALMHGLTTVVRITGDCPCVQSSIIDDVVGQLRGCGYVSNVHPPTYPDGMDVEAFTFYGLEEAWKNAKLPHQREHVTSYMWETHETKNVRNAQGDFSSLRLTVDHPDDLSVLERLLQSGTPWNNHTALKGALETFDERTHERNETYGR